MTSCKRFLSLALALFPTLALAQTPAAAPNSAEEQITELEGKLDALQEQYAETRTDVLSLKRLKFSGYIQSRLAYAQNSTDAVGGVKDGFSVRRGRLKATYDADWSRYVLQIDATPSGVALKDAEAWFIEPWSGYKTALVVGQTKWPFGYEVVQSSGEREFLERSRVVRSFLYNERDRGAKVLAKVKFLQLSLGVFDGNGTSYKQIDPTKDSKDPAYIVSNSGDNDRNKDVIGRIGVDFKWFSAGVSGWFGKTLDTSVASVRFWPRNRLGADAQIYLDLLPVGATAIKGEFITGKTYWDYSGKGLERFGTSAHGYYLALIQNLGLNNAVALRYDSFDPMNGRGNEIADPTTGKPGTYNTVSQLDVGLLHYYSALKFSLFYSMPVVGQPSSGSTYDPRDNSVTFQVQATF